MAALDRAGQLMPKNINEGDRIAIATGAGVTGMRAAGSSG
jgi:hypothetical protein